MPEMSELEVGAVAVTHKNDIVVVVEHKPQNTKYPVIYTNGKTRYKAAPQDFKAVIGVAEPEKIVEPPKPSRNIHASWCAPEELRDVKPETRIVIRNRRNLEVVVYNGYNPRRPKNPLSITTLDGKECKGPAALFVRVATPEDVAKADAKGRIR